jgi:hypothetical protein
MADSSNLTGRRIVTVAEFPTVPGYGWLSVSALRHLIFMARPRKGSRGQSIPGNGLEEMGAVMRIGRRVLIDLDRFDAWMDTHRQLATPNDGEKVSQSSERFWE